MGTNDENDERRETVGKSRKREEGDAEGDDRDKKRSSRKRSQRRRDDDDDDDDRESDRRRRRRRRRRRDDESEESEDSSDERRRKRRRRKKKKSSSSSRRRRKKRSRREDTASEDDDSDDSETEEEEEAPRKVVNQRLLKKLEARGETLEEREERRAQRRAARITAQFGYTADDNPFNDPNLHETFTWKKKTDASGEVSRQGKQDKVFHEIEKVRQRRKDREQQFEEMERIRAEESRMRELENYDEWARKEEEFHLLQQRQRSAIRLVEGREKPIDVLAKNMLMFGLTEDEMANRATVKYQEKYNAMNELENLEAELDEPHTFLKVLKLEELDELLGDIEAFRRLERDAVGGLGAASSSSILRYWDNIHVVAKDEIEFLRAGGKEGSRASTISDIHKLFEGQSSGDLVKMKGEVEDKLRKSAHAAAMNGRGGDDADVEYWRTVLEQLSVHEAKVELSQLHCKMLARQLERLEKKKEELKNAPKPSSADEAESTKAQQKEQQQTESAKEPPLDFQNLDEELGLGDEIDLAGASYAWQDKFRPRKPRYFNRVKTGYDWNKYNQTHYDQDNPPPKTVQGYKFNIFYPDLIDKTNTPQFSMERADSDEFCIIRFRAGPPYEDIAFKIINREWNRSRKQGYRCTFERGVLSLYFNFKTHWYRR